MGGEGNGTKGIEQRLLAERIRRRVSQSLSLSRLSNLMPVVPSLQRGIWAVEPAEQLHSASFEVRQRISLTSRLVEHPASGDVESCGEFVCG